MLEYKEFREAMLELKKQHNANDRTHKALSMLCPDDYVSNISMPIYDYFVTFLMQIMNDKSEWIAYYVYELGFGLLYEEYSITDKDGKPIPLKTIKDLWNIIKND